MISSDPSLVGFISTGHREHTGIFVAFNIMKNYPLLEVITLTHATHTHVKSTCEKRICLWSYFFNLCWLRSLSLPGWMIGLEPWSPEIDKIEQWTTPRAWHSQHWGCDFCTWFAWFAGTGKAEGTIYFMAALHWLYIGSTWSTSSTDSSQDSFGSQTTNNS